VNVKVEVAVRTGDEKLRKPVKDLVKAVLAVEKARGLVSVAFVDEQEMAELNALYRGLDSSTDVLSFGQADGGIEWPDPTKGHDAELGEVVVCLPVVALYATEEVTPIRRWGGPYCTGFSICWVMTMRETTARCGTANKRF
jgi:ssRNA-specific RNase YbeY (16S rRNA maturation enzyme)